MENLTFPLLEGLEQLRRRMIIAGAAWLIAFCACYSVSERLFRWLARPLYQALPEGRHLVFLNATEPFFTLLKLSAVAALVASLPVILWQIGALVFPARPRHHKIIILAFVAISHLSFLAGAYMGFTYVFPLIFNVLIKMGMNSGSINAMLSMESYLSLGLTMLVAFGAVFELPLLIVLLARFGIVDHQGLRRNRKYMLIVAFIFGGVITPGPDVLSQSCIAVPFVILYEVGILGARIFGKKRQLPDAEASVMGSQA